MTKVEPVNAEKLSQYKRELQC